MELPRSTCKNKNNYYGKIPILWLLLYFSTLALAKRIFLNKEVMVESPIRLCYDTRDGNDRFRKSQW